MLRQMLHELVIRTGGRGFYEFTAEVAGLARRSNLRMGLVTLHLQHTSASLLIQENADPEVRRDLERFFSRLAPDGDPLFQHTSEGDDDMPAHIRTALTCVNLGVPIAGGVWRWARGRASIYGNTGCNRTGAESLCICWGNDLVK